MVLCRRQSKQAKCLRNQLSQLAQEVRKLAKGQGRHRSRSRSPEWKGKKKRQALQGTEQPRRKNTSIFLRLKAKAYGKCVIDRNGQSVEVLTSQAASERASERALHVEERQDLWHATDDKAGKQIAKRCGAVPSDILGDSMYTSANSLSRRSSACVSSLTRLKRVTSVCLK